MLICAHWRARLAEVGAEWPTDPVAAAGIAPCTAAAAHRVVLAHHLHNSARAAGAFSLRAVRAWARAASRHVLMAVPARLRAALGRSRA